MSSDTSDLLPESYTHPYFCLDGCGWRGERMDDAEAHYVSMDHAVGISTSTNHNVQAFPTEDEMNDDG